MKIKSRDIFPVYRRDYITNNYNKPDKEKILTILKALIIAENELEETFKFLYEINIELEHENCNIIKDKIIKFIKNKT
jgi:hypothetical protein